MPKFFEEDMDWDSGCAMCGNLHFKPGSVPGLCTECSSEAYSQEIAYGDGPLDDYSSSWDTGWSEA